MDECEKGIVRSLGGGGYASEGCADEMCGECHGHKPVGLHVIISIQIRCLISDPGYNP